MKYQACFFDLYGTLMDIRTEESKPFLWEIMSDWYSSHGARYTPDELREAYLTQVEAETESVRKRYAEQGIHVKYPEPEIGNVFSCLFEDKEIHAGKELIRDTAQLYRQTSRRYFRLYAGAAELLESLRQAGIRVCLLSNAQRLFTEEELRESGIYDLFEEIFISSDYGVKKPDPVFFETAVRKIGMDPSRCLMVGNDIECDMEGAVATGMSGYYIYSKLSPDSDRKRSIPAGCISQKGMNLKLVQRYILRQYKDHTD